MSRLTGKDKARNVAAVRAAIEQLLQGDLPLDGKYDLTTLASMAGVARTGFYSRRARDGSVHPGAYQHLAEEFEHRLKELQEAGRSSIRVWRRSRTSNSRSHVSRMRTPGCDRKSQATTS